MSAPFLKKSVKGWSLKLSRALYSQAAVEELSAACAPDVAFKPAGKYWDVTLRNMGEEDVLEAANTLLQLSRRKG